MRRLRAQGLLYPYVYNLGSPRMCGQHVRPGNAAEQAAQAAAGLLEASLSEDLDTADTRLLEALTKARVGDLRDYVERVGRLHDDFVLRESPKHGLWATRSRSADIERRLLRGARSGAFVLMCSKNGFERQHALEAVKEVPSAFCLGLLIVRLNDWVKEVQTAACLALDRQAASLRTDHLLECFELYLSSSDWGRMRKAGPRSIACLVNGFLMAT
jgi:hypothetical protein